ncbi:MAG: hypothetical protein CMD04_05055 [Flavobacteriales bacterium]|nr:hypothetical protein [Flavobacteriales bacterium]|tara:strand:+ start:583 stop:1155 length:573 start_codon:yes stop_codon:yes gene_type:complete
MEIIKDSLIKDIELIPYSLKQDDSSLKKEYLSWLNDKEVTKLIASQELQKEKDLSFIDKSFARFTSENCKGFFIFYKPDQTFIGTAKLDKISQYNFSAEDGILIGNKKYWGMGLSKKVYKLLLLHAFNDLNLRKIIGGCNENNLPMVKTFQSLGYQLEGRLRKVDFIDDNFSDHFYFGIFKEEFFKHNKC